MEEDPVKPTWKKSLTAAMLSASLVLTASPALIMAADGTVAAQNVRGQYQLTSVIRADVKSIINERVADNTRIGAVVRLYNEGSRVTRVPDYEMRVKTADGIEYTLKPSVTNAKAIQPKEKVELSYMLVLDYESAAGITDLSWIEVDEYVYPKLETAVLTVPVAEAVWSGNDSAITGQDALKRWGEPFKLQVLSETLQFTPVTLISEKTPQGPVTVVTLIAENTGSRTETVPEFRLDGKSDSRAYPGRRVQTNVELKPGEKKYIHYGILTENNVTLTSLNVLTPETYVQIGPDNQPSVESYAVGRINVQLPQKDTVDVSMLPAYELRDRIQFDPMSKLIDKETEISLVDLSMNESESSGYNTVIAKFMVKNTGERPVPLPAFQTELTNADGFRYSGTRQTTTVEQLAPKLAYVVNYSFAVPSSEKGDDLLMKITDNQTVAPYNIPIGGFKTAVSIDQPDDDILSFYPYEVKMNYWSISSMFSAAGYMYKMKMDIDINTVDDIVSDTNASNMTIELHDTRGRLIASQTLPFAGMNKLVSGAQHITFDNLRTDQLEWPLTIKIYESVQTPNGVAKRLVKTMKQ
jgi:hypothetical protein